MKSFGRYATILLAILCACTEKNESYYLRRGEEVKQQLCLELESVQTLRDLFARQESLTLLFDELSRLAVEAKIFQLKSKTTWQIPKEASLSGQRLSEQLQRVLSIPGASAFLEKCQARGLEKIDAFEKSQTSPCRRYM